MTRRELIIAGGAALFVLLALAVMAGLHERHYRTRTDRIRRARGSGIEARIEVLEDILSEDRLT